MRRRRWRLWLGGIALVCFSSYAEPLPTGPALLRLPGADIRIDPNRESGLRRAIAVADECIRRSEEQERQLRADRQQWLAARSLGEMSYAELKRYFSEPDQLISDKDRRGWKELRRLATAALKSSDAAFRQDGLWQIREISAAMQNNHRSPAPPHMDLLQPPLLFMDYAYNPIAKGERPAYNLERGSNEDLSVLDPRPSSFWKRPDSIAKLNLYHGFGRNTLPDFENRIWEYAGPKTSYGGCPGFEARSGGIRLKVKFAETISEPFTTRIFWALGYNVEATDYVHSLKLKYDRRFFREFHLRKDVEMKLRALMIPVDTVKFQQRYDPFDYIQAAVLKSGERISGAQLRPRLLRDSQRKYAEDFPENFRTEVEEQIDYVITTPANVQTREEKIKSIGPWDFQSLDHAERRELRAAGLLGAWLGWFDSRFENTRLKIVSTLRSSASPALPPNTGTAAEDGRRNGANELRHYFTDLGGGLGRAKGVLSRHCECPNDFPWRFTRPPKPQGKGKMTIPFRIVDYQPIEDTEAFRQMTIEDARWMARLIAQLTEAQIVQGLVASGCDATEVRIYTEKLLSRRDWMIRDLALTHEVALLRPNGIARDFSYDPQKEGVPEIRAANESVVKARPSGLSIQNGVVVPELHTRTPQQRIEVSDRGQRSSRRKEALKSSKPESLSLLTSAATRDQTDAASPDDSELPP